MLNVDKDRLNYAEILMPPEDYYLQKAIATSYSLDLFTLLSIPVALFYSKNPESKSAKNDSVEILDAIQKTENIVSVFCQKGKIKIPVKYNDLFAFIENSINEVSLDEVNASFHPKIWVLRYIHKNTNKIKYRIIVLSRNLTFDRSWDIAFYSDGEVEKTNKNKNLELVDFLEFLSSQTKKEIDKTFITDLQKVNFDMPNNISEMFFHPIILFNKSKFKNKYKNPILKTDFDKLLIISPFLDKTTLKNFTAKSGEKYLFSRKEELDKIENKILESFTKVYHINTDIVHGEDAIDDEEIENSVQNLHAKVFILEKGKNYTVFMGSANCTRPAFERNIEFLTQLNTTNKNYSVKAFKESLLNESKDFEYFLEYKANNKTIKDNEEDQILRALEYDITNGKFVGNVKKNNTKTYDLALSYDLQNWNAKKAYKITVKPYNYPNSQEIFPLEKATLQFNEIGLKQLSSFIKIEVFKAKETVLKILIKADIEMPKERNESIFKALVDSSEKFFMYLNFLISENHSIEPNLMSTTFEKNIVSSKKNEQGIFFGLPIFEKLMIASSRNKASLNEVSRLIERLEKDDKIITQEFKDLWNVIKLFAKK